MKDLLVLIVLGAIALIGVLLYQSGASVDPGRLWAAVQGGAFVLGAVALCALGFLWRLIGGHVTRSLADAGKREVDARLNPVPLPLRRLNGSGHPDTDPPSADVRFEDEETRA